MEALALFATTTRNNITALNLLKQRVFVFPNRSWDPNVTPLGLCPGRGPAECDGQAYGACGGSLLRGFKFAPAEHCTDQ